MTKRWKMRTAAAMAVAALLVLSGCSDSEDGTEKTGEPLDSLPAPTFAAGTTMAALQSAPKIDVGVKFDQPGFGQVNPTTNKPEGFDVEIAKLIVQGIYGGTVDDAASKINWVEAKSKDREPFIISDKVDMVVATYTINSERKKSIDFAGPYYTAHGDILVKSSENGIKTVTDLNGKKVCVVSGSTYPQTIAAKAPQAEQLALPDYSSCEQALRDGRVVAMATDNVILMGLVSKSNGTEKILNTNYTDEPYGIGLKKGDQALRNFVNDRLQAIYDNGAWKTVFEAQLGKLGAEVPKTTPTIDRYTAG